MNGWTLTATFTATGVDNGLDAAPTFVDTPPAEVLCVLDMSEEELWVETQATASPPGIATLYDDYGYYDVYLTCGEAEFAVESTTQKYVGTAITDVDVTNGTYDIFVGIPFESLSSMNKTIDVTFATGLDVTIIVEVLGVTDVNNPMTKTQAFNSSNLFTLNSLWFGSGLYTIVVNVSNPLTSTIQKNLVFAIQTSIKITSFIFEEFPTLDPATNRSVVIAGTPFHVKMAFTSGDNVTIVATLLDSNTQAVQIEAELCTGSLVGDHYFMFNTSMTGNYTLNIEASNYINSEVHNFEVYIMFPVNNIVFTVSDQLVLETESLQFNFTVQETAMVGMGLVTCTLDYDDGVSIDGTHEFLLDTDDLSTVTTMSHSFTKGDYTPRWYNVRFFCDNLLPDIVTPYLGTAVETTLSQTFQVIVERTVVGKLKLDYTTTKPTEQAWSKSLDMNVRLSTPADPTHHLYNVTCVFHTPTDTVDQALAVNGSMTNVTVTTGPIKFAVGDINQTIDVNCSNFQTHTMLTAYVKVYYDCWSLNTFFTSGKNESTAILAYTNVIKEVQNSFCMFSYRFYHFYCLFKK